MTSDDPDASLDASLGDTVVRSTSARQPIVVAEPDVEDTRPVGSISRPVTAPVALVPPKITTAPMNVVPIQPQPLSQSESQPESESHPHPPRQFDPEQTDPEQTDPEQTDETETLVPPVALVQPPAPARHSASLPPRPGNDIPNVSDNIWSESLPEKPLPFRLLLDDGTIVPLDQPVYLGRKPSVPRIHPGGVPLLVTMDSPQREVSSTHLELTTVGGAIVATDLKSTNGSVLRPPGGEPRALVAGASAVVTPGTVIELGDGNTIELLAPDYEGDDDANGAVP